MAAIASASCTYFLWKHPYAIIIFTAEFLFVSIFYRRYNYRFAVLFIDLDDFQHINDFGTGFSSLRYLHQFPLNVIKIDRSFVETLNRGTRERCIIHSIVTLGRSLNLATVAEGIETPQQLEKLRSLECESGQGYLFSKPIPGEQIEDFLLKPGVLIKPAPKMYNEKHLNTFNTVSEQVRQVI